MIRRQLVLQLPLVTVIALFQACSCQAPPDEPGLVDADGDGFSADEDCDDADAARYPGNPEVCDGVDNDCNDLVDDNASDMVTLFADEDGDGYGDPEAEVEACPGFGGAEDATDCDDGNADVNPGAVEVCNDGVDDDCDGSADEEDDSLDLTDAPTWYADTDSDGFGDPEALMQACLQPEGYVADDTDCDDTSEDSYPDAPELCDGADNDCDTTIDEDAIRGYEPECPALSCADILDSDASAIDGDYYLDATGGSDGWLARCDMTTDGGGWTLLAWTNDNTQILGYTSGNPRFSGIPYPGLAECSGTSCSRGSSASVEELEALIQLSGEFGVGHTPYTLSSVANLGSYTYAMAYDYGSLAGLTLDTTSTIRCDTSGFATGTSRVIAGSASGGVTVYLAQSMRYYATSTRYNTYREGFEYIWLPAQRNNYCDGSYSEPSVYLGSWYQLEHGPYLGNHKGARSVWIR